MKKLTQARLKELLHYSEETGFFINRVIRGSVGVDQVAGTVVEGSTPSKNRILITIDGKSYNADRLVFLYIKGKFSKNKIKHTNGDSDDNRWCNLK